MTTDLDVRLAADLNRYEAHLGGVLAGFAEYVDRADQVGEGAGRIREITHTQTLPAFSGRGVASAVTGFASADIRDTGLRVRPTCSFARAYIERHPEFQALVA